MPVTNPIDRLAALGDPTRRRVLEIVAASPRSVADISRELPVSRPAVSQHLRVLAEAGLVTHRVSGTRHFYQLDPSGFAALRGYLDSLWETALSGLKADAERTSPTRREKRQ